MAAAEGSRGSGGRVAAAAVAQNGGGGRLTGGGGWLGLELEQLWLGRGARAVRLRLRRLLLTGWSRRLAKRASVRLSASCH